MTTSTLGITNLCLPYEETVTFPSIRSSIRTHARQIEEKGCLVEVYLYPGNPLGAIQDNDRFLYVIIDGTLLVYSPP